MKCPKCKEEIDFVFVVSECYQRGTLKNRTIVDYGEIEKVLETIRIECPKCYADLTNKVVG